MHFFHEKLATQIGINESIFLQNIYYLCKNNLLKEKIDINLNISVTMSRANILEYQEYFSYATIRNITKKLLQLNLIEIDQIHKSVTNSLSYSLTTKGWLIMFFLEKNSERKKIESASAKFEYIPLLKFTEQLLKETKGVLNLTDLLSNSKGDLFKLADIIIEYRNLIESNRNIENTAPINLEDSQIYLSEIEEILSKNLVLKNRIEKTFKSIQNYMDKIILPAITKFGGLKVIQAIKKTISEFFPSSSPVFNFYENVEKISLE